MNQTQHNEMVQASLASLGQRHDRTNKGVSKAEVKKIVSAAQSQGFRPVPDTEKTLATQATGTQNAWTKIHSGAPTNAGFAKIMFEIASTSNTDVAEFFWRGAAGVISRASIVSGDEDDAQPRVIDYPDLSAGEFEYLVDVDAGSPNWSIRYMGYSL